MKQMMRFLGAWGIILVILAFAGCQVETTEYTLTVSTSGSGSVSPTGGTYDEDTTVTLTATPASGWVFAGWSGDASGTSSTIQIIMDSDKSVRATFTQSDATEYTLAVSTSGSGSVSPTGGTYDEDTTVTLTATPASGWVFAGWSGDASGTSTSIQITMDSDKSVTANFSEASVTNGTFNGTYSMIAVHSGKAVDVWNWGMGDGTNIAQYDSWGGEAQLFNIKPVDGIWHRITPVISAAQSLEVKDGSTDSGANVQTWTYWGHACQQFRFQSAGSGKWRIINRNSEMCLDVNDSSQDNGANIMQYDCLSGEENQMFELVQASDGNRTQADNPIIKQYRSADPSPFVHDGRYYIVFGEDQVNTNAFNMYAWRLVSSDDMIHWTDHGIIARPSDYSWMPDNCAWASCIVYRNGYFYFYTANDYAIGVLRSRNITGPYTDVLGRALIDQSTPNSTPNPDARDIDPMCFIDDDGQAYLFWGGDGICKYAELTSDMAHLATGVMDVPGLSGSGYTYLEAPFVIKTNGTYFLMYADQPWPSEIRYATSSSIRGPWTHRGVIGTPTGTGTNHEGAAYFNGQWWYTYHTEELSGGNAFSRSVCVDPMVISGNTIRQINYSSFD